MHILFLSNYIVTEKMLLEVRSTWPSSLQLCSLLRLHLLTGESVWETKKGQEDIVQPRMTSCEN